MSLKADVPIVVLSVVFPVLSVVVTPVTDTFFKLMQPPKVLFVSLESIFATFFNVSVSREEQPLNAPALMVSTVSSTFSPPLFPTDSFLRLLQSLKVFWSIVLRLSGNTTSSREVVPINIPCNDFVTPSANVTFLSTPPANGLTVFPAADAAVIFVSEAGTVISVNPVL